MSSNINRACISGNLTRDAELRGGGNVLSFSVAVNDRRKNPDTDEWEDVPNFIDCVMFCNRAAKLERWLTKGTKVFVEGKLRWSQWETDGGKRSKVEVVVSEVEFSRPRDGDAPRQQARPAQPQSGGYVAAPGTYQPTLPAQQAGSYDEEIPF